MELYEWRLNSTLPMPSLSRAHLCSSAFFASHAELARKLGALEKKYNSQFKVVFVAIRQLMAPKEAPKKQIGFHLREERSAFMTPYQAAHLIF